jgi:glycerol-3-phosphate acyltransferase PlsY
VTGRSITALAVAYAIGSIPFGLLTAWTVSGRDVRHQGSGSIGATNVLRGAGWLAAAATLLLDAAKGALGVVAALAIAGNDGLVATLAAPSVVAGAVWSPWLRFRGGKGAAAGAGALGVLAPVPLGASLVVFALVAGSTRLISAGSSAAATAVPVVAAVLGSPRSTVVAGILVWGVVLWAHRGNWARIAAGTEPRWPYRGRDRGSEPP